MQDVWHNPSPGMDFHARIAAAVTSQMTSLRVVRNSAATVANPPVLLDSSHLMISAQRSQSLTSLDALMDTHRELRLD